MDIIIGAGISGLSYANFCGHDDYLILEADKEIGGYCKTIKRNGFVWDYSGHFFHFRNPEIEKYLLDRMPAQKILKVKKSTQIKYKKEYVDFPFQKNIHQLPKEEFIDCLFDLFNKPEGDTVKTFKESLHQKFGQSICDKFLFPYNEKLYACNLDTLDKDAMGRFFPYANAESIIQNFKKPDNSSYNDNFTYPENGAIQYVNALNSEVDQKNLSLNERVIGIDLEKKEVLTSERKISYDRVISSMPFPKLLELCNVEHDRSIYSWNKVLVFNLGFDSKGADNKNHWVYFPEKKYSFYRIGYYDNILGQERMSLYVELGFQKDENINIEACLSQVLIDLKEAGIVQNQNLIDHEAIIMDPAYVHINQRSIEEVDKLKKELSKSDVYSIGRYGSWTYCSIEDNIIEAKNLAIDFKG